MAEIATQINPHKVRGLFLVRKRMPHNVSSSELAETISTKKALSPATLKAIDQIFKNSLGKNILSEKHEVAEETFRNLYGVLCAVLGESGNFSEFYLKSNFSAWAAYGKTLVEFEIGSRTTGYYARFNLDYRQNRTYLFATPGISSSQARDIMLQGANSENAKQLIIMIAEDLLNFSNPAVWKTPYEWAVLATKWLVNSKSKDEFNRNVYLFEQVLKNFTSGQPNASRLVAYASSEFPFHESLRASSVLIVKLDAERSNGLISEGKKIVSLELGWNNGELSGRLNRKNGDEIITKTFEGRGVEAAILKMFDFLSNYPFSEWLQASTAAFLHKR